MKPMGTKNLTFSERCFIQASLKNGKTLRFIAKALDRSDSGLSYEINNNGGHKIYDAHKAQERFEALANRFNRKTTINQFTLREEIQNLQMQIDILTETIGRIKNGN